MPRPSARDRVLDALEDLLLDHGNDTVTLDAVAERAQVSKGGLLYHFGSKAELYQGLLDRLRERIREDMAQAPTDPAALVRWFLTFDIDAFRGRGKPLDRSLTAAFRATARDQAVSEQIAAVIDEWNRLLDVLDPPLAEHVRLLANGISLDALTGDARPRSPHRDELIDRLAEQAATSSS